MVSLNLLCIHIGVHLNYLIASVKNIKKDIDRLGPMSTIFT